MGLDAENLSSDCLHLRSLISTLVIHLLEGIISKLAKSEISIFGNPKDRFSCVEVNLKVRDIHSLNLHVFQVSSISKKTFVIKESALRRLSQVSPLLLETVRQQRAALSLDTNEVFQDKVRITKILCTIFAVFDLI